MKKFEFLLDPNCLEKSVVYGGLSPHLIQILKDLPATYPGVIINLYLPNFLNRSNFHFGAVSNTRILAMDNWDRKLDFVFDQSVNFDHYNLLKNDTATSRYARSLLSIAEQLKFDGIITNLPILTEAKYLLHLHHRIKIISKNELSNIIETIAHGCGIFWGVSSSTRNFTMDTYYAFGHEYGKKFTQIYSVLQKPSTDKILLDHLTSMILHRLPFILYSRDMIQYHELYRDQAFRHTGSLQNSAFALGYYVNYFNILIWGLLDHLAVITKLRLNMSKINERDCGINNKEFLKNLNKASPQLSDYLSLKEINDWIKLLSEIRHPGAHGIMPIPTVILQDTEESLKSDEEISHIIESESMGLLDDLRDIDNSIPNKEELKKSFMKALIQSWRMSKAKAVLHSAVYIENKKGEKYFRNPIGSVDVDLEKLINIMEKFLEILFKNELVSTINTRVL